ncbi:MAG: preprotein translocase subunit YajC [Nesterenkonia sp.]|uniref:preprotein translocase subunit YajC n=1 Tax=Nesterenkonia marinintestina TaxID=2979865 RepID=UPI0021C1CA17|nr:preprotein translocase subunit YajC [Nesterenkonia sp. GX14115]MDO5492472.1 preprotein translocase subunit YajC [Nesterenkonia sp.]
MTQTLDSVPATTLLTADGGTTGGFDPFLLIMFAIMVIFVIVIMRRGKKMRDKQLDAMSGAVIGAEVLLAGGMVGTVVGRDEERQRLTVEFSSGDRVDFLLQAVQQVLEPASTPDDPTSAEER